MACLQGSLEDSSTSAERAREVLVNNQKLLINELEKYNDELRNNLKRYEQYFDTENNRFEDQCIQLEQLTREHHLLKAREMTLLNEKFDLCSQLQLMQDELEACKAIFTNQDKTRQEKTRPDNTRQIKTRQEITRLNNTRQIKTRQYYKSQAKTRQEKARQGKTRQSKTKQASMQTLSGRYK
jgi:hypothetical protein